jgi:hypothetical protein
LGGDDSPPRPSVFLTEVERRKWKQSEGARNRSTRHWTNWGLTPPGKLAKYGNNGGKGSSSGGSSLLPRLPIYDGSEEEELVSTWEPTFSAGDYVHGSNKEDVVIA